MLWSSGEMYLLTHASNSILSILQRNKQNRSLCLLQKHRTFPLFPSSASRISYMISRSVVQRRLYLRTRLITLTLTQRGVYRCERMCRRLCTRPRTSIDVHTWKKETFKLFKCEAVSLIYCSQGCQYLVKVQTRLTSVPICLHIQV